MPKKLVDCVKQVTDSGKSESEAWAICQKSTGLKPHKKKKEKAELTERLSKSAEEAKDYFLAPTGEYKSYGRI